MEEVASSRASEKRTSLYNRHSSIKIQAQLANHSETSLAFEGPFYHTGVPQQTPQQKNTFICRSLKTLTLQVLWHSCLTLCFYDSFIQKGQHVVLLYPWNRQLVYNRAWRESGKSFQIDRGKLCRNSSCVWPRVDSQKSSVVHPKCVTLVKAPKKYPLKEHR